jgi:hypothetical protein
MIPAALTRESFQGYPPEGRSFAVQYLDVLQRLPPALCPSFLLQIKNLDTSFPAEKHSLQTRFGALAGMPAGKLAALLEPFEGIRLPENILQSNWVDEPAKFITAMTAFLWSSGLIDHFREATQALFAALPDPVTKDDRMLILVIGQGTTPQAQPFGRLSRHGVLIRHLDEDDISARLLEMVSSRVALNPEPFSHWYIDGGENWPLWSKAPGIIQTSYHSLTPLRMRVLSHMKNTIFSGDAGTEAMQTHLSGLSPRELNVEEITSDPVLQRYYTELFTLSSGPQLFSTSFVQWAGRELIRRAQPDTILLRYAPRQHHRGFNEMVAQVEEEKILDPQGSLRDAQMGAYYAWLEARRMAPSAVLRTVVLFEGSTQMLLLSPRTPEGIETATRLTLSQALAEFC